MPYSYDPIFAVDPANSANIAKNASITIFDPADPAQSPIAITDPTGSPLPNPITVDAAGMAGAFQHPTLARVGWKGAGFTGYFTSYEGMFNETVAAKDAAQEAASEAATGAAVRLDELIAAGSFEGPAGPLTNLTVGTVEAVGGNPLTDEIVASEVQYGAATVAALNATIVQQATPIATQAAAPTLERAAALATMNAKALMRFRYSLAATSIASMNVMFLGHSIIEGYSSTITAWRFADSTVNALRRRMGLTGGLGHKKAFQSFNPVDYPVTVTGNKVTSGGSGMAGSGSVILGTNFATEVSASIPAGTTSVDIVYTLSSDLGSFTYALDGGAQSAPVVQTNTGAKNGYQKLNIPVASGSGHTLRIIPNSGYAVISGITFYAGDENKGIRSWEGGRPGATSQQWLDQAITTNNSWLDMVVAAAPKLLVFEIMCNDYYGSSTTNNVTPEQSRANIKAILDAVKAKCPVKPSVVLCIDNMVHDHDATIPRKWAEYVSMAYELAEAEGYAVFDFYKRLGSSSAAHAVSEGMLNADKIHPSAQGHMFKGEALAQFLAPS